MKILTAQELRELEEYTILNEPVLPIELTERAAKGVKRWISENINTDLHFHVFCGTGNNGGDGLALARLMKKDGYRVSVHLVKFSSDLSLNCAANEKKFLEKGRINYIAHQEDFPELEPGDMIIDAVFGSGLNRAVEGISERVIEYLNDTDLPTISIDVPSGMYCNHISPLGGAVVEADITLSFQLPKLSFLIPENEDFIGQWHVLDIGLSDEGIEQALHTYNYLLPDEIGQIVRLPSKFAHKAMNGHGLLVAGSKGKAGASVLATRAAMRSGIGLVTAVVPECNNIILQASVPEAMTAPIGGDFVAGYPKLDDYHAVAIGPGLGVNEQTAEVLDLILEEINQPLVLDADAINLLTTVEGLMEKLPLNTILTPHIGEFDRLVGPSEHSFERLDKLRAFSIEKQCLVVLKGAYSAIAAPNGQIFFNSSGNPGMATAGMGDALTGILLGLLAQGYHPLDACLLGVYLHGLAGDLALEKQNYESMMTSDVIDHIGKAYAQLLKRTYADL